MNLKENKEGYMGRFGGKREKWCEYLIISIFSHKVLKNNINFWEFIQCLFYYIYLLLTTPPRSSSTPLPNPTSTLGLPCIDQLPLSLGPTMEFIQYIKKKLYFSQQHSNYNSSLPKGGTTRLLPVLHTETVSGLYRSCTCFYNHSEFLCEPPNYAQNMVFSWGHLPSAALPIFLSLPLSRSLNLNVSHTHAIEGWMLQCFLFSSRWPVLDLCVNWH